jgi:uncharacterized membrane protein YeaQ/YmgE (transglycosylase-associated protein family)
MFIIWWLIVGLIAGALARLLVPGSDPMGWGGTLLLGLVGSLVGGFLGNLIFGGDFEVSAAGIIGATIGAIIALLIYRSARTSSRV